MSDNGGAVYPPNFHVHEMHRRDDDCLGQLLLSQLISDNGGKNIHATHTEGRANADAIASASRDGMMQECSDAKSILLQNCENTASIIAADQTNAMTNLQPTERNSAEVRLGVERTAAESRALTDRSASGIRMDVKDNIIEGLKARGSIKKQLSSVKGSIKHEVSEE